MAIVDEDDYLPVEKDEEEVDESSSPLSAADIQDLSDVEFGELMSLAWREQARREVLRQAAAEAERLASRYLEARDDGAVQSVPLPPGPGPDGQPVVDPAQPTVALSDIAVWVQPTGAHDAYPQGYPVQHGGRVWRSKVAGNVWEPGADGPVPTWEDITDLSTILRTPVMDDMGDTVDPNLSGGDDDKPDVDVDPDPAPSASEWVEGGSYEPGDRVTFDGSTWECVSKHTAWPGTGWTPSNSPSLWAEVK